METYHRKRSKRSTINTNNEIVCFKRQETGSMLGGAQSHTPSSLARQNLLDTICADEEDVELGSVYEIAHCNLPPRTPVQLRSTRVVMVSEKTELNVAIRYASVLSLKKYFSNGNEITDMYPALDEKFVMGIKLARKVLLRQVPSQEFAQKKHLEDFWVVNSSPGQFKVKLALKNEDLGLVRELQNNMVKWGVRRQVEFIRRHKETSNTKSGCPLEEVKDELAIVNKDDEDEDEKVDDEEEKNDDETDEEEEDKEEVKKAKNHKRKLRSCRNLRKRKKVKQNNQLWQVQATRKPMGTCKKLARDPSDRWSKERYMAAELSLLEAMQEKNAIIGNPITRPVLRVEARKRIGDTGLLDHLLKHVANKVAPGGALRFRRSHNADGAMEYWLEDADLIKIRKEAGVSDPFWTPPPGWKLGDSPIQDPNMAKELNHLKEKLSALEREKKKSNEEIIALIRREKKKSDEEMIALIKREKKKSDEEIRREFLSKKECDEKMTKLRRDMEELISKSRKDESQSDKIMVSENVDMRNQVMIEFFNSLVTPSESSEPTADNSMEKCKKEKLVFPDFLKKKLKAWMLLEEEVGSLQMEAAIRPMSSTGTELNSTTKVLVSSSSHSHAQNEDVRGVLKQQKPASGDEETSEKSSLIQQPLPGAAAEGKAAMIERLKSGFRICRPQGTFLWPNMVNPTTTISSSSSQLTTSHSQDMLTPPSVNSSYLNYHHLNLSSPVKPFPERRPITIPTTTINLNDIPNSTIKSLLPSGAGGFKKRNAATSPSSSSLASPSCFSNTGTPPWLLEPPRHQQHL